MTDRIPILRMGRYLVVTIQSDLHDRVALALQDDLMSAVIDSDALGVLIDVSGLEVLDSFVARMLGEISQMTRVAGAQTAVVGIRPAVAITLVELGLTLEGVLTAMDIDKGMRLLQQARADGDDEGGRT